MESSERRELIRKIVQQEEEKYGTKINVETPTVVEYYIDSFKKGYFDLSKHDSLSVKINGLLGFCFTAYAQPSQSKIVVFDKDRGFASFIDLSLKYLAKKLPLDEILTVVTTFHEVRHILQDQKKGVNVFESFCCDRLSRYDNLKYYVSASAHDGLFSEIAANYYGVVRAKDYYAGNQDAEEYLDKMFAKYTLQGYDYDFDSELEMYQQKLEEEGFYGKFMYNYEAIYWNKDGTFKNVSEIVENPRRMCDDFFDFKLLASDSFLSRLNIENLSLEEIEFLNSVIEKNKMIFEGHKNQLIDLHNRNLISDGALSDYTKLFDGRIKKKEEFRQKIVHNTYLGYEEPSLEDVEKVVRNMTSEEEPKKVKKITTIKNNLKQLVDNIPVYAALIVADAIISTGLIPITDNAGFIGAAASVMGTFAAYNYINKTKK